MRQRQIVGWEQQQLAKAAGIAPTTVSRMEACGAATVKAHPHNLELVLTALEKRGVVIEEDGIRLNRKQKSR